MQEVELSLKNNQPLFDKRCKHGCSHLKILKEMLPSGAGLCAEVLLDARSSDSNLSGKGYNVGVFF
jgi:hypothetical protein